MNFTANGFKLVMVACLLIEDRQDPELQFYHFCSLVKHTILPYNAPTVMTAPLLFTPAVKSDLKFPK